MTRVAPPRSHACYGVVPVLNESAIIGSCLERLRERTFGAELSSWMAAAPMAPFMQRAICYARVLTKARGRADRALVAHADSDLLSAAPMCPDEPRKLTN